MTATTSATLTNAELDNNPVWNAVALSTKGPVTFDEIVATSRQSPGDVRHQLERLEFARKIEKVQLSEGPVKYKVRSLHLNG